MRSNKDFLECPFCGEKPTVDYGYCPAEVTVRCENEGCSVNPSLFILAKCIDNPDNMTFTPLFDESFDVLKEKWNVRKTKKQIK